MLVDEVDKASEKLPLLSFKHNTKSLKSKETKKETYRLFF